VNWNDSMVVSRCQTVFESLEKVWIMPDELFEAL
jgi:hypothetical protein